MRRKKDRRRLIMDASVCRVERVGDDPDKLPLLLSIEKRKRQRAREILFVDGWAETVLTLRTPDRVVPRIHESGPFQTGVFHASTPYCRGQ